VTYYNLFYVYLFPILWLAGGQATDWGTAVHVGRSRVRFQMVWLEYFIDIILPAALWTLESTQPLAEMSTRNISWWVKHSTFMCRMS